MHISPNLYGEEHPCQHQHFFSEQTTSKQLHQNKQCEKILHITSATTGVPCHCIARIAIY